MRIGVLSADVGHVTSGQSRFTINLALGLSSLGAEVTIFAEQALPEAARTLYSKGVAVLSRNRNSQSTFYKARMLSRFSRVGRDLVDLALREPESDWYIVLSDSAISAVKYLSTRKTAYICQGDLYLMFLNPTFYSESSWAKRIASYGFVRRVLEDAVYASEYDLLLGNSEFTKRLMAFLYSTPFDGFVYPPVDPSVFSPEDRPDRTYLLAIVRNRSEQGISLLEKIAKGARLKVVGSAKVHGAESVGIVSDAELRSLYSGARCLVFPNRAELFGYAVAESMSCGTPVLAFDNGGPAELVRPGINGWLCDTEQAFVETALRISQSDMGDDLRVSTAESSHHFSMTEVSAKFLEMLRGQTTLRSRA